MGRDHGEDDGKDLDFDPYFDLGKLIKFLQDRDPNTVTKFGIRNPHSFRGNYSDLALEPTKGESTVGQWLEVLEAQVGTVHEGWKGGDYTMGDMTDVWFSYEGDGGDNKVGELIMLLVVSEL